MKRGEIWTVAAGPYASKPHPAIIVQDDAFEATESVTIVPLTTHQIAAPFVRVAIPADATNGITHDSQAMADKVTTVRRANLGQRIGAVTSSQLRDVERALVVFLGIAR